MAAVPVTIVGMMHYTDLSVGGGPMPPGSGGGGSPPGIWGGAPIPWPTPPIYYPPGIWGPTDPRPGWGLPPPVGIWPSPGHPAHPIYWPPGIWGGGNVPMPTPPIANVPGAPGGRTWKEVEGHLWEPHYVKPKKTEIIDIRTRPQARGLLSQLALQYGVNPMHVRNIRKGKTWKGLK